MANRGRAISDLVRVSVVFDAPVEALNTGEAPENRLKLITSDTDEKSKLLLGWLQRNNIAYSQVTVAGAFGTIFLSVPRSAVPRLKTAPGVADVDEEVRIALDPLSKTADE